MTKHTSETPAAGFDALAIALRLDTLAADTGTPRETVIAAWRRTFARTPDPDALAVAAIIDPSLDDRLDPERRAWITATRTAAARTLPAPLTQAERSAALERQIRQDPIAPLPPVDVAGARTEIAARAELARRILIKLRGVAMTATLDTAGYVTASDATLSHEITIRQTRPSDPLLWREAFETLAADGRAVRFRYQSDETRYILPQFAPSFDATARRTAETSIGRDHAGAVRKARDFAEAEAARAKADRLPAVDIEKRTAEIARTLPGYRADIEAAIEEASPHWIDALPSAKDLQRAALARLRAGAVPVATMIEEGFNDAVLRDAGAEVVTLDGKAVWMTKEAASRIRAAVGA